MSQSVDKKPFQVEALCDHVVTRSSKNGQYVEKESPQEQLEHRAFCVSENSGIQAPTAGNQFSSPQKDVESSSKSISSLSVEASSSDLGDTESNRDSTSNTSSERIRFPSSTSIKNKNDLLSISAWTDPFDITHPQYLHPLHDNEYQSCLEHMPTSLTNHEDPQFAMLDTFDRWFDQVSAKDIERIPLLREQDFLHCPCVVIRNNLGVDVGEPGGTEWIG